MFCLTVGGMQIDQVVVDAFLKAVTPAAIEATQLAMLQLEADQDAALGQWRLALERARYEAERAERQYRAVEPENRLVARGLETEWEKTSARSCRGRSRIHAARATKAFSTHPGK